MFGRILEICDSLGYARAAAAQAQLGNHEVAQNIMNTFVYKKTKKKQGDN